MRRFACPVCRSRVFFDDLVCVVCGTTLGYRPGEDEIVKVEAVEDRCPGFSISDCSWLPDRRNWYCASCVLDTDPNGLPLEDPEVITYERARRRVVRQFLQLGIDASTASPGLRFELERSTDDHHVTIGHADGLVTLDLAEADPAIREANRQSLGEPYRTPLGHVRHESGHWHWQAFVANDADRLAQFRDVFGDERDDYAAALEQHYDKPDDGSWSLEHISHYAAAHPWEDYAESFAHVLHLLDTLETARHAGLALPDPGAFDERYATWVEVTVSLNELSRSMGVEDAYPFAPAPAAVAKLHLVHDFLTAA